MKDPYKSKAYALFRLRNRLHYLETQNPVLWEAVDEFGRFRASAFNKDSLRLYSSQGCTLRKADLAKEISELKARIDYYKKLKE